MPQLTDRQTELLHLIADCWRNEAAPVVAELAEQMGLAGQSSVTPMLHALQRKGFIIVHGGMRGRQRRIVLTAAGKFMVGMSNADHSLPRAAPAARLVPLLGMIPAGALREAVQSSDSYVDPGSALRVEAADFFLEVDGDSMIGDGILAGDYVLLRPNRVPQGGEIAAVHIGEEYLATLKHVHFDPARQTVQLRASNPAYEDVTVPALEVRVAGVFRGLIRPHKSARR